MLTCLALVFCPAFPAAPSPIAQEAEPIRLEVDPQTKMPRGEMVAPRGELLDPRDLPEAIHSYFDPLAGLDGIEQSLAALLLRQFAFVLERDDLPERYEAHALVIRDRWNEAVKALLPRLAGEVDRTSAALYHDTGRRLDPEAFRLTIVSAPRLHFEPLEIETLEKVVKFESLIGGLTAEMEAEQAAELLEVIEPLDVAGDMDNPWFHHAKFQVLMMKLGAWKQERVESNPFDITGEEFMKRCREGLQKALVDPLVPECSAAGPGKLFFYEGPMLLTSSKSKDEAIAVPQELIDYNRATRRPALWIHVPKKSKRAPEGKLSWIHIALIASGGEVPLYEGSWPLR